MRLTNTSRERIARSVAKSKLEKRKKKLAFQQHLLAREIRQVMIGGLNDLIESLPVSWVNKHSSIEICDKSDWDKEQLGFADDPNTYLRMPMNCWRIYIQEIEKSDPALSAKAQVYMKDMKDFRKQEDTMFKTLYSAFCGFSTSEKLLKEFPELTEALQNLKLEPVRLPVKTDFSNVHKLLKGE